MFLSVGLGDKDKQSLRLLTWVSLNQDATLTVWLALGTLALARAIPPGLANANVSGPA